MYSFSVNNRLYTVGTDKNLLDFLRDVLGITSLKNGCAEGSCGACMILVDGRPIRACLFTIEKVNNKKILTVEGLSDREKTIYSYAFGLAGAVQCGFCIPGMVISAKALLDTNLNPDNETIAKAIRGNLCRCTGYLKIIEAIQLVATILRDEHKMSTASFTCNIGERLVRIDAVAKILGSAKYCDDLIFSEMLFAAAKRSEYPRARILSIDINEAEKIEGVVAILTARDIPGNYLLGYIKKDWPVMIKIGDITNAVGDAIAIVAATDKKIARTAAQKIVVKYELLEPILDVHNALLKTTPTVHEGIDNLLSKTEIRRGNVQEYFAKSKYKITEKFKFSPVDHAFLEPESSVALVDEKGVLTIYTSAQGVYEVKHGIMDLTNLSEDKVRVISCYVGGSFGGKEDISCQHFAALLSLKTGKPIKYTFTREESLLVHPKRHGMEIDITLSCDEKGLLTGLKSTIYADTGAYASLGTAVLQRACTHSGGPYKIPAVDITGLCVYTNNPPAGAFRGFGVPQSSFALETCMDILAEKVGMSTWDIRWLNAVSPGDCLSTGQICDQSTAIKETLSAIKKYYDNSIGYVGLACGIKNIGKGTAIPDKARTKIIINKGKAVLLTSAQCIGQGLQTAMLQIMATTTGLSWEKLDMHIPDTSITPDAGSSTASRQTLFTGEATRLAAIQLKGALENNSLDTLEGKEFYAEYGPDTDSLDSPKDNPYFHVAYSYATQLVILDDQGYIKEVIAAHDVGKAINPLNIEGQVEGGVAMGIGVAVREDATPIYGVPLLKYGRIGLLRANEVPKVTTIIIEKNSANQAFGAKGIGEISMIPIAAAIGASYYKFDQQRRKELPLKNTIYKK